ncbi:hypothetical protein BH09SUM1_BH09SUM1_29330 [soil metagenome]
MPVLQLRKLIQIAAAGLLVGALGACSTAPKAVVTDYDSFQTVKLGAASYTTPIGFHVIEEGPGYVIHSYDRMPDTYIRTEVNQNPPRSLKFDADAEKRKFMDEVPGAILKSVQYRERDERRRIRVLVDGLTKDNKRLYGSMMMVREEGNSAVIKVVGPYENRAAISRLTDNLASGVVLKDQDDWSRMEKAKTAKDEKPAPTTTASAAK